MGTNVKAVLFLSQVCVCVCVCDCADHSVTVPFSQLIAKGMVERGMGGAIVNVSSVASHVALMDHTAYCQSHTSHTHYYW